MTESVWDYPRPPALVPCGRRVRIELGGVTIADSGDRREQRAAWSYPDPVPTYAALRDHLCFYPSRMDACWLGDERVAAQAGDFYGGWITAELVGPFKGGPGTLGW